MKLDKKDCMILNLLQINCRMSLTEISRKVHLSVDSTKKRINKMIDNRVFFPRIQLRPRNFGFTNIVDVKIKLQNTNEESVKNFIEYLKKHPKVVEIFLISGECDLSIVIVAKDSIDLGKTTQEIRNKFGRIINSWNESLTVYSYKFEDYDMTKLMKYKNNNKGIIKDN
ncbi:MAG: Lrp/AsnC family transcriptional regulator [Candidatus Woesearchaeota archaeon]|nr:MAG: Lrp/AsnC family transcriptional regulator [Candidatus Woesearchaeota archaeon]